MVAYGKTAKVRYRGTLADGTVFDSTEGIEPLEFVVGSGAVIHGFDEAVAAMEAGEKRTVTIPAREAYGDYREDRIEHSPHVRPPNAQDIKVGKLFYFVTRRRPSLPAKVLAIDEGHGHGGLQPSAGRQGPHLRDRACGGKGVGRAVAVAVAESGRFGAGSRATGRESSQKTRRRIP